MKNRSLLKIVASAVSCITVFAFVTPTSAALNEDCLQESCTGVGYDLDGVGCKPVEFDENGYLIESVVENGPSQEELEATARKGQVKICPECGKADLKVHIMTAEEPHEDSQEVECKHHIYGTDLYNVYDRWYEYHCDSCDFDGERESAPALYDLIKCGGYED